MSVDDELPPRPGRKMMLRAGLAGLLVILMSGAAFSAAGLFQLDSVVDEFVKEQEAAGRSPIKVDSLSPSEAGAPQTIMILGTDARLGADEAVTKENPRSDTIILARLNAKKDAITLMSIPRDLKVNIPGYQLPDKINAAYSNGGANLTVKTVKELLSRPGEPFKISHVIQVSFTGFRRMVDYLGCTYVDIDRRYFNDVGGPGGFATIDIQPGYQKICGKDGLDYVRFRHTDNDLIRGARQQDFIRQMLRQPGVKQRLSLGKRKVLARIAGRYTSTDKGLRESKQIISLLKLGLGVAQKPVQEVPFGDGRIADEGPYLVASQDAINDTVDQFMNPKVTAAEPTRKTTEDETGSDKAEREPSDKKKAKKKKSSSDDVPSGIVNVEAEGETQAISVDRKMKFPFYYPKLGMSTGRYVDPVRVYQLKDEQGKKHQSYRMVVSLGAPGEFYGIQGTQWKSPPLLDGPRDTVKIDGRKLLVYYDGRRVRLVAWKTRNGLYYVHNTLARDVSKDRLIAIARSLTRLGAK